MQTCTNTLNNSLVLQDDNRNNKRYVDFINTPQHFKQNNLESKDNLNIIKPFVFNEKHFN